MSLNRWHYDCTDINACRDRMPAHRSFPTAHKQMPVMCRLCLCHRECFKMQCSRWQGWCAEFVFSGWWKHAYEEWEASMLMLTSPHRFPISTHIMSCVEEHNTHTHAFASNSWSKQLLNLAWEGVSKLLFSGEQNSKERLVAHKPLAMCSVLWVIGPIVHGTFWEFLVHKWKQLNCSQFFWNEEKAWITVS